MHDSMSTHESFVQDEVEALRAIYGEEQISFQHRQSDVASASITISLESLLTDQPHPAGCKITLSALLPNGYPRDESPKNLTLRSDSLSAAAAEKLVERVMDSQPFCEGEVCLFQYCEEMISILNDFRVEEYGTSSGVARLAVGEDFTPADKRFDIFHSEPLTDRKSVFQAHIAHITSTDDVDGVLRQLKQANRKIATATHNTLAYRIEGGEFAIQQDADDDGEKGAGKCVLYVLQQIRVVNVVCIVSRWFGGTKLGPVRFKHICKVARDLMEKHAKDFPSYENAKH